MPSPKPPSYPKAKGVFKYGAKRFEHQSSLCRYTVGYISVPAYLKQRFITRNILATFIKKGWVLVTKSRKTRLSVKECCSDLIDEYLGM